MLADALQKSECVLVFWSANSAPSPAVREEYSVAIQLDKDIAPVLLDETPLQEELRCFQWIDCRSFVKVVGICMTKPGLSCFGPSWELRSAGSSAMRT